MPAWRSSATDDLIERLSRISNCEKFFDFHHRQQCAQIFVRAIQNGLGSKSCGTIATIDTRSNSHTAHELNT